MSLLAPSRAIVFVSGSAVSILLAGCGQPPAPAALAAPGTGTILRIPGPADEAARRALVRALLASDRIGEARRELEAAVRGLPASAPLAHQLARLLAAAPAAADRDPERAVAIARRLIELRPTAERAETLAIALAAAGRAGEAAELGRTLAARPPAGGPGSKRAARLRKGETGTAVSGRELLIDEAASE